MADWSKPTVTSNYVTFVDEVKNRDIDAITLQVNALVNPPMSSVKMARVGAPLVKFQEWNGSAFVDKVLGVDGGGTGVTTIPALKSALALGTMADQNANAVNISGGNLNAVGISNANLGGNMTFNGGRFHIASTTDIALNVVGMSGNWVAVLTSPANSQGVLINAASIKTENAFYVRNAAATIAGLIVRGDMGVIAPTGLIIPVGTNKFVPA
jgi:hypothetical protein